MDDIERRAVLEALRVLVRDELSMVTGATNEAIISSYKADGVKMRDIRVNGQIVGTCGPSFTREKTETALTMTSEPSFMLWALDNAETVAKWLVFSGYASKLAEYVLGKDGEVCGGFAVQEVTTPQTIKDKPNFNVDAQKVIEAMGAALPGTVAALLEGGK